MSRSYGGFLAITFAAVFATLSGCAANKVRMDGARMDQLKSTDKINVVYHGPQGPAVQTAGDAVKFQFTMALAGWGTPGLQIMAENGIDDPMVRMRAQFINRVATEAELHNLVDSESPVPPDKSDVADIQELYNEGLYLQLIPGQWSVIYYMANWNRYHMYYGARARLVRAEDGEVLWSSHCEANQDDGDKAPNMDELMANQAERLKTWTYRAAQQCADQLADHFLGGKA